ncbi:MAG: hypothetical protein IKZ02_05430 [Alphaproteobacteria bacterium]|nr:hypothetical protein [Alphaproteobacteria bacterium]
MKHLWLLSVALVAGCVPVTKEYTIIRETSRPVVSEEIKEMPAVAETTATASTQGVVTSQPTQQSPATISVQSTQPTCSACAQPAPTYYAGTYTTKPQIAYTTTSTITEQASAGCGQHVICGPKLATQMGGNVMNMQTQTMQNVPVVPHMQMPTMPLQTPAQTMTVTMPAPTMTMPTQMVQTEVVYETPVMQLPTMVQQAIQQPTVPMGDIILQHPTNRDLVKCSFGDTNCIMMYESQGYIQMQNTSTISYSAPQSTYQQPTPSWTDNNIPRW